MYFLPSKMLFNKVKLLRFWALKWSIQSATRRLRLKSSAGGADKQSEGEKLIIKDVIIFAFCKH